MISNPKNETGKPKSTRRVGLLAEIGALVVTGPVSGVAAFAAQPKPETLNAQNLKP